MSEPTVFDEGITASRFPILGLLDRPDDLPAALEDQLVSPHLRDLVEELSLFTPATADSIPPGLRARILASGLRDLTEDELRLLMRQPRVLLELQRAVLSEGGAYWDAVLTRTRTSIAETPRKPSTGWYRSPWAWAANAVTGLAAALAVTVFGAGKPPANGKVERQLREEVAALKQAHPPVVPADLPDGPPERSAVSSPDPPDLPEIDPEDLPEAPKTPRPNVDF